MLLQKAWPLCTLVSNQILETVLSEVEKDSSITLPGKGETNWSSVSKNYVFTLGGCDEGFYNNNSKLLSNCGAKASPCGGSSCCGAQALSREFKFQWLQHMGSAAAAPGLENTGSAVEAHGLSGPAACEIFMDQESNQYLLHDEQFECRLVKKPDTQYSSRK